VAPPVPAEHGFVEVVLKMGSVEAVVDAEPEPLQIRKHAVNPR
jgi:hypothetical protein